MPTITLLEFQKKNPERVNVYLDGEFAFGLNAVDASALRKGQFLDDVEINTLRHQDEINRAFETAVNLLSYRPRSTKEIRIRLSKKAVSEPIIEAALDKLQQLGYLDDRAFARFWIEDRNRFKPRGERALRYELRDKGVSDAIISEVLDEMVDEGEAAYKAAQPRIRRMRGKTQREFKNKIGSFLQRRGFGYDVINSVLDQLITEIANDEPDFFLADPYD